MTYLDIAVGQRPSTAHATKSSRDTHAELLSIIISFIAVQLRKAKREQKKHSTSSSRRHFDTNANGKVVVHVQRLQSASADMPRVLVAVCSKGPYHSACMVFRSPLAFPLENQGT